jgi:hypothetical protein
MRFNNFKFNFLEFQYLRNKYAKKNPILCICNSNPFVKTIYTFSQVESSILNKFNKYKKRNKKKYIFFHLDLSQNYFVPNINCRYGIFGEGENT